MGQKIFELYKESLEKYPYVKSEDNLNNNDSIEEEQNETERLNYVLEEIEDKIIQYVQDHYTAFFKFS